MSEELRFVTPPSLPRPGTVFEAVSAVAHRPAIPARELDAVLRLYGLIRLGRPRNFALGWRSSIVWVSTEAGRLVLKRYRDDWEEESIRHEHSVLDELDRVGFPAVRFRASGEGKSFVTYDGGRYAVFEYVPGRSLTGRYMTDGARRSLFLHVGGVLAQFHSALSGFTPEFDHHLGYTTSSGAAPRDLAWHMEALDVLFGAGSADHPDEIGLTRQMDTDGADIETRIVELDRRLTAAELDTGVVHGDFGPHNVIFDRSGRTVVHDLELARVDWRMLDLVGGLSRWREDAARAFLQGYRRASPGSAADIAMLPAVWEHYRLCGAIQSWYTYRKLGDPARLATARRRLDEAVRLRIEGPPKWIDD